MVRSMKVVEYSLEWPRLFDLEATLLRTCLGGEIVHCHHIGSTSVPGLAAKPIIDILIEVRSVEFLDNLSEAMSDLGYQPMGELGIPGRRYFPKGGDARTHHVHAFAVGDPQVRKHLAFRDYLRTYPTIARSYAEVKKEAAAAYEAGPEGYVAFKHDFVERMVAEAVHWANSSD